MSLEADGLITKYRQSKTGVRRRFPINCGSMAKPFGCGKPNLVETQPWHSKVYSRDTPARSRKHCSQQKMEATTAVMIRDLPSMQRKQCFLTFGLEQQAKLTVFIASVFFIHSSFLSQ